MKIKISINIKLIISFNIQPLAGQEGSYAHGTELDEEE